MDQLTRSNKHRAEVIEVYENGSFAVKFTSGRIECIAHRGLGLEPQLGVTGMADYVRSLNGYEWIFTPFRKGQ